METLSFRMPNAEYEQYKDANLDALVGMQGTTVLFGESVSGVILSARRYNDTLLGPGIWISLRVKP